MVSAISFRQNLHAKVISAISLVLLLGSLLSWFYVTHQEKELLLAGEKQAIQSISKTAASFIVEAMLIKDYPVIQDYISQLSSLNPYILSITLTRNDGKIITKMGQDLLNDPALDGYSLATDSVTYAIKITPWDSAPEPLGVLTISSSLTEINQAIYQQTLTIGVIWAGLYLAIVLSLFLIFRHNVFTPLEQLQLAAEKISQGDMNYQIQHQHKDQFGVVMDQFNAMVRQINERESALIDSEAQYRDLYDNAPSAYVSVDPHSGEIIHFNHALCTMLGYAPNELIELCLTDFPQQPDIAEHHQLMSQIKTGEIIHNKNIQWLRKDGMPLWLNLSAVPVTNDQAEVIESRFTLTDITPLKTAQRQAEQASEAKTLFLSRMSHELRTPMNAILGFAQLEKYSLKKGNSVNLEASIEQIISAGAHLLMLIEDILDVVKTEQQQLNIEMKSLDTHLAISESMALVESLASSHNITLNFQPSQLCIVADRRRFKQVIINLLTNAIKYNQKNGSVTVTVESSAENLVAIHVTDTGVGIAYEDKDEVFHPFSRLTYANQHEIQGIGIGLTLVKLLVEEMNGKIDFHSTVGKGSTFTVQFAKGNPVNHEAVFAARQTPQQPATSATTDHCTVLYIEDDAASRTMLEIMLKPYAGITLFCTPTSSEGIKTAEQWQPNILFIDINLPDMNGIDTLRLLRKKPQFTDTRIVAMSANAMPGMVEAAMEAGFDRYLTKPVDIMQVINEIKALAGSL